MKNTRYFILRTLLLNYY